MTHRIGIAALIALCACSINEPDPAPTGPDMATEQPASPDADSLPSTARLIPEPVDSVEDVPGKYVQPFALPGQVSVITLAQPNFATGNYELYRSCGLPTCVREAGQYHIVPTNPAIGFAALSLVDDTGLVRSTYILDLLWRDAEGHLVALQLRALVGNATGPAQVWWKLPDANQEPTDPGVPSMPATGTASESEPTTVLAAPASKPKLGGVFVRALPIYGDIGAITLDEATWTENTAKGTYHAAYPYCLPWCFGEDGTYELDLSNVATGTGHLSLVPTANPTKAHDYVVYAIWRTVDGTPSAIQLQRFDGVVPSGPLFTVYRQWWTGATATAAAEPTTVTCSTWLNLAAYYRIRALQCGMGACWPLAGWYSSWAQYYQALADAAGCTSTP
jgi:hypothetical protein